MILVCLVLGSVAVSMGYLTNGTRPSASYGIESPVAQTLDVTYTVYLSGSTGLLEGITHSEALDINVTVPANPTSSPRNISLLFIGGSPNIFNYSGVTYSLGALSSLPSYEPAASVGPYELITYILPNSAGTYYMGATGTLSEESVLGENGAEIPLQYVNSTFGNPGGYNLVVRIPPGLQLQTMYSYSKGLSFIGQVPHETYTLNDTVYVSSNYFTVVHGAIFANVVTVLYDSESAYIYAAEIAALLVVVLLSPYWAGYLKRAGPVTSRLVKWIQHITPKQLLSVFVLVCLLTVAFSFVVGPNPHQRVYVMGTDSLTLLVGKDIRANTTLTPISESQVEENSATVSTLGGFAAIVLVDPSCPTSITCNPSWDLVPYSTSDTTITLAGPTHVIIVDGDETFDNIAEQLYAGNVKVVNSTSDAVAATEVVTTLNSLNLRQNPLGLNVSSRIFRYSETLIAILSFVLAFLAMAFLASKVAEIGLGEGWLGIAEALGYAFFAFAFLQMVYIACSVFLAVPLGLHSGNPQITAAGTIPGLAGGGSRPRELAGILGFVFGALTRSKLGIKIDRLAIILTLGVVLLLILDPLTDGVIFHELVLALTAGASQGPAAQTIDFVGGLLFNIGNAFGSLASQWYFIQRGLILYFAGAVSFVLVPKLQKTTGTFLLLFSAFLAGDGIVRVADMIPLKTMASTIPGFMAALLVIAVFLLVSSFEKLVRNLFTRR
jgi:hypothetical protein